MEPATKKQRLLAVVIDCAVISLASAIAAWEPLPDAVRVVGLAAGAAVLAANLYYMTKEGQTLGKRVAGVRIVKSGTGENGGFVTNVLLRGGAAMSPYFLLMLVHPALAGIYIWVDVLFIYRQDRRCIHDHIAGTLVVQS